MSYYVCENVIVRKQTSLIQNHILTQEVRARISQTQLALTIHLYMFVISEHKNQIYMRAINNGISNRSFIILLSGNGIGGGASGDGGIARTLKSNFNTHFHVLSMSIAHASHQVKLFSKMWCTEFPIIYPKI